MRPIDADALHFNRIRIAHEDGTVGGYNAVVMSAEIKDAPTIDAVPVVRCKDCKYKGWSFVKGEMKLVCDNENGLFRDVQMNDFCSAWDRSEE